MDGAQDCPALFRRVLQRLYDVLSHERVEARRRLVTEHQRRVRQHLSDITQYILKPLFNDAPKTFLLMDISALEILCI